MLRYYLIIDVVNLVMKILIWLAGRPNGLRLRRYWQQSIICRVRNCHKRPLE